MRLATEPRSVAAPAVVDRAERVARSLGAGLVAMGVLVLIGWATDVEALLRIIPGGPRMVPYTALAFCCFGTAVALGDARPRVRQALLVVLLAWSVLTLAEWLLGLGNGFDALLTGRGYTDSQPGRAAPPTVVGFGLLAVAAMTTRSAVRTGLLTAGGLVAFGAVIGHVLGVDNFYGRQDVTGTALHTAIGLLVATGALTFAHGGREPARTLLQPGPAGVVARIGLVGVVAVPLGLSGLTRVLEVVDVTDDVALAISTVVAVVVVGTWLVLLTRRVQVLDDAANGALARLHDSDERRKRMFADVSHELRSPLTVMLIELDRLRRGALAARPTELDALEREAREMRRRVDELLALAALRTGEVQTLVSEPCDLAELARAELLRLGTKAATRGARLELRAEPVRGEYDPRQVRTLLSNLIRNAIKHGRDGGTVTVTVSRASERTAVVTVDDDGPGVPAAERETIFERFRRGAEARPGEGVGVGLAIARDIAVRHLGTLTVGESPAGGARFRATLPCDSPTAPAPDPVVVPGPVAQDGRRDVDGRPTVLVVDDHPAILNTLQMLLRGRYGVLTAADADEAIRIWREQRPDVVVTDQVPATDGGASGLDQMLALESDAPLIVMTGDPDGVRGAERVARLAGILRKPFSPEALEEMIDRALAARRTPEPPPSGGRVQV